MRVWNAKTDDQNKSEKKIENSWLTVLFLLPLANLGLHEAKSYVWCEHMNVLSLRLI